VPGVGRRWQWIGKPPLDWTVLAIILLVYWVALILSPHFLVHITDSTPSPSHAHARTVVGGVRYMNPLLWGCYDKGEWVCASLLILLILIMFFKRDQIERFG
jgi:hypothetical protein